MPTLRELFSVMDDAEFKTAVHGVQFHNHFWPIYVEVVMSSKWESHILRQLQSSSPQRLVDLLPPGATVGGFHDSLLALLAGEKIKLTPWTGAMYQLPQPGSLNLILGHEIMAYAEIKK